MSSFEPCFAGPVRCFASVVRSSRFRAALAGVRAAVLAAAFVLSQVAAQTAVADPQPGRERVWVKFLPGGKVPVERALQGLGAEVHFSFDTLGAFAVSLPPEAVEAIRRNPHVEYVEPDPVRMPLAQSVPWGIDMVQARDLWDANRDGAIDAGAATGAGVLVCVVDSGLHRGHQDLADIAKVTGKAGSEWSLDTCGHGTHVAGTIAAVHNGTGVVGVSPGAVDLHIVRVFSGGSDGCGWTFSSGLLSAVEECAAAAEGRKVVVNMSLGGGGPSSTERNGFQRLFDQGVLSVAAAGNGGDTSFWYPASYDSVISVAAVDSSRDLASFSQRNSQVELAAPGKGVRSTVAWSSAALAVDSYTYEVSVLDGSFQGSASGALADGGRCLAAGAWSGKVVLCERGGNTFAEKVANATQGGAVGVVVYNDVIGDFTGSLGGASSIPALATSRENGLELIAGRLGSAATASSVFSEPGSGYQSWSGTSMATPHVSAIAALLWSAHPEAGNQAIREALAVGALDLGDPGRDDGYGWGLVQAKASLDALGSSPSGPVPPEEPAPPPAQPEPPPADTPPSALGASVVKYRGTAQGTRLGWTTGSAGQVDVYRDGALIAVIANGGDYLDDYAGPKRSRAVYRVCVAGDAAACSNEAAVRY